MHNFQKFPLHQTCRCADSCHDFGQPYHLIFSGPHTEHVKQFRLVEEKEFAFLCAARMDSSQESREERKEKATSPGPFIHSWRREEWERGEGEGEGRGRGGEGRGEGRKGGERGRGRGGRGEEGRGEGRGGEGSG